MQSESLSYTQYLGQLLNLLLSFRRLVRSRASRTGRPKPAPARFGCVVQVENPIQLLLGDSGTAVGDSQFDRLALQPAGKRQLSAVRHRLLGVGYQVGERFVNQSAIGLHRRQRRIELVLDFDLFSD